MFQNVVAIVSGGASGLGAATASYLVRNGARVIVADLPSAREQFLQMQTSIENSEGRLKFSQTDVTSEEDVVGALNVAEDTFGEQGSFLFIRSICARIYIGSQQTNAILTIMAIQVNVAVNCAGVAPVKKTLSIKQNDDGSTTHRLHSLADFTKTININVSGTFNLSRLAADRMVQRHVDNDGLRGCIINTASVAAYDGQVGQVAYAASKGAIVGMTLPMARDLAPLGIRVMTIVSFYIGFIDYSFIFIRSS
jgi:3-hydroxyacyl-CoA dehydrogenase/3-hydroxy-2-methylbutyryl-CoA dehydrogenase